MSCVASTPQTVQRTARVLPLTQEERDEIVSMLVDGKSASEITDWIGCSVAQVRALMRDSVSPQTREERNATAPSPALNRRREAAVVDALRGGSKTIDQLRRVARCPTASADNLIRRLHREGRVRRVSGGRHMPGREKACIWALVEAGA